jgi:hypothetical protein
MVIAMAMATNDVKVFVKMRRAGAELPLGSPPWPPEESR